VATVSLTVTPVNDAPVAVADAGTVAEGGSIGIAVLANDTDDDTLVYGNVTITAAPLHGTVVVGAAAVTYTHDGSETTGDSFAYQVCDSGGLCASASVTVTVTPVNDSPRGVNDAYTTAEDTPLTVAAPGVLGNDTDAESDPLTVAGYSQPAHGAVVLNQNGSFTYTPNANYTGSDSFTYRASDGMADSNVATVSLTVTPVNDAPVAAPDSYTTAENTPLVIAAPGVLGNDSDVDGDGLSAILMAGPAHGTVALNPNGSLTYTPALDYSGPDSFTYQASDGNLESATVTVSLVVTEAQPNRPPVAKPDSYTTNEDTTLTIAAPGVLANDTDPDGDPLTAALVSQPAHGTLTLSANGSFVYSPAPNFNGSDSFTYRASDGSLASAVTTVKIKVKPVNDEPDCSAAAANPSSIWPPNHKFVTIGITGLTDPDGGKVSVKKVTSIYQDEPTNTDGDGDHAPDGKGVGSSQASVRAERSGTKQTPGNGRVYTISFSAADTSGASCTGIVTVCVPHDQGGRSSCVDDGPQYDSTVTWPRPPSHDEDHCSVADHDHSKRKGGKDDDKYRPWSWGFFHWSWR
jgi:VCBS repeat-containing protein